LGVGSANDNERTRRLLAAIGRIGIKELGPDLLRIMRDRGSNNAVRAAAMESLVKLLARDEFIGEAAELLDRVDEPVELRRRAAGVLGAIPSDVARAALVKALATAPADLQIGIVLALLQSKAGVDELIDSVQSGKASARVLQDALVAEQLKSQSNDVQRARIARLTKDLSPPDESIAKALRERLASFDHSKASPSRGREVFAKHCATCHRIGEAGGTIGPQLDGVGSRGPHRLLEDILDTNRNVDLAFRTTMIVTVDGRILSGLRRRSEGKMVVLAGAEGKEIRVPMSEIETIRQTNLSVMPANFRETLSPRQSHDLLAWLLQQTAAKPD
jgi:putative heme-binding domain-containing protein